MVQQAGLHVNSGQMQDELGKFPNVCVTFTLAIIDKVPDISPPESVHHVKNMIIV